MKIKLCHTFIKPSTIHGLGLFARVDISKGTRIKQGEADINNHIADWIKYVKTNKVKSFEYNNGYCMINHSETSNTHRGRSLVIIASIDIKKGDEIT